MGRKLKAALISSLLCLAIFGAIDLSFDIIENVTGDVFYVNTTGSGGAFTSIQDAINASSDGDTVFVYNGTYYENVVVNKTINLTGEDSNTTIIDGRSSGDVIHVDANWVNISGFTVTHCGSNPDYAGIELHNVKNCRIFYITAIFNFNYGIYLNCSLENHITNNTAINNWVGIYLYNSSRNNVNFNNASSNSWCGIYLHTSSNNTISSNNASLNDWEGINIVSSSNDNIMIYNNCSNDHEGIRISISHNNYMKDNTLFNNQYGIRFYSSTKNNITENEVTLNKLWNIYLDSSSENDIKGNVISGSYNGIYLDSSSENNVTANTISDNQYAIYLESSNINKIQDNTMIDNGIFITGDSLEHWNTHTIDTSNMVNGKPLYYLRDKTAGTVPQSAGQVVLANCSNIKIEHQEFTFCTVGIVLGFSSSNNITNNSISNNIYGIYLESSTYNLMQFNNVSNNDYGISLYKSTHNNLRDNSLYSNNKRGINFIKWSSFNNITKNHIYSNGEFGIYIEYSSLNRIYHNNIINNIIQAYQDDWSFENYWNDSYPSGGNYWSDYTGKDGNGDGIGDTAYHIDIWGWDVYPLINPVGNYIFLYRGWNLISIPFIQSDTNLGTVLSSIKGSYTAVQWYDASEPSDPWKHNCSLKPPHLNDLNDIDHLMGFWIYITQPSGVLFEYFGIEPNSNQTITLHPGWNLAGYPSLTNHNRTEGLNNLTFGTHVDAIWTYNAANQKWKEIGPSDYFEIGKGYWVHAKTKCEWEVPL